MTRTSQLGEGTESGTAVEEAPAGKGRREIMGRRKREEKGKLEKEEIDA